MRNKPTVNLIKLFRLWWHLRKVPGGYRDGEEWLVVSAFIKAGVFKESERKAAVEELKLQRVADAFNRMAEALMRGRE